MLNALPMYFMSLFRIPTSMEEIMKRTMRNFLWHVADEDSHCHIVEWDLVYKPIERGGLGIEKICEE